MDFYHPNSAWLCLRRDTFDLLYRYKMQRGLPTWEQALENLLTAAGESTVANTEIEEIEETVQ